MNAEVLRSTRSGLLLALMLALLAAAAALAAPPAAGPPELKVEVVPASVEIPAQGQVEALVVVRNPLTDTLRDVRLAWFTDAGVTVTAEPAEPQTLAPYGALAWTLRVAPQGQGPAAGVVHLRVDYTWPGEQGETPAVATGDLAVTAAKPESLDQVAQVRVETTLTSLVERRPEVVYLVVGNVSDVPITVTQVTTHGPQLAGGQEFVAFKLPPHLAGTSLAPHETRAFPVVVEAAGTVQPGKHLLIFEVGLSWEKAGHTWTGSTVASQPVDVGVVGESVFLTLLGVPSFLVLPGFLMVVTVSLLWGIFPHQKEFPYTAKTQEFWVIAIALSLLAAFFYPKITGLAGVPRDYLEGYGLLDLMLIWSGSIIVACFGYFVVVGARLLYKLIAGWWTQRHTPTEKDDPITLLYKLHRQGLSAQLPRVNALVKGAAQPAYLLQPQQARAEKVWVGPEIVLTWVNVQLSAEDKALRDEIVAALEPGADAATLAERLARGKQRGILAMRWKVVGNLRGPYLAALAGEEPAGGLGPKSIVEEGE